MNTTLAERHPWGGEGRARQGRPPAPVLLAVRRSGVVVVGR